MSGNTHGEERNGLKTRGVRDHMEDLDVDGRKILKLSVQ
jgi:hypothetical protein